MLKPAFSTVACPNWPLREVLRRADDMGYEAVELRTFGDDSKEFACDPALTSPDKTRTTFENRGLEIACLATSLRFDHIFGPPVLGPALWDQERFVREGRRAIDLASSLECPFVRVFAFQVHEHESRATAIKRISERLRLVGDHARSTGVRVVVENGGGFAKAADLRELLHACDHDLVGACYSNGAAFLVDEDPEAGVETLGDRLWVARLLDGVPSASAGRPELSNVKASLEPCELGTGRLRAEYYVRALVKAGTRAPLVYEVPLAWSDPGATPDRFLESGIRTMFAWIAGQRGVQSGTSAKSGGRSSGSATNPGAREPIAGSGRR